MATIDNDNTIQFPTPSAAWSQPTHFGLFVSASGSGAANFLGGDQLSATVSAPAIGADVQFAAGAFDITIPDATGDLTAAGAGKAADGVVSGGVWVSLHSADPGSTGTNELTGGDYARVEVDEGDWS